MRKILCFVILLVTVIAFSGYGLTTVPDPRDTIMNIGGKKVVVKVSSCTKKHENGCHNGGYTSIACSIDNSYYPCIGVVGGACSISCREGSYACCGKECRCIPNVVDEKCLVDL